MLLFGLACLPVDSSSCAQVESLLVCATVEVEVDEGHLSMRLRDPESPDDLLLATVQDACATFTPGPGEWQVQAVVDSPDLCESAWTEAALEDCEQRTVQVVVDESRCLSN